MAQIHGIAGEWARVRGTVTGMWPMFLAVGLIGFSIAMTAFGPVGVGLVLLVLSLVLCAWTMTRGLRHVERFYKGARGEERVSGLLAGLPASYHVFNDFVVKRSHVDHVVVGPAGVFVVETKFWRGSVSVEEGHVLVDRQLPSRSPLNQVVREAELVKAALVGKGWTGPVTPVLAFAGDNFNARIEQVGQAVVINACEIVRSFTSGREVMSATERERLVALMES